MENGTEFTHPVMWWIHNCTFYFLFFQYIISSSIRKFTSENLECSHCKGSLPCSTSTAHQGVAAFISRITAQLCFRVRKNTSVRQNDYKFHESLHQCPSHLIQSPVCNTRRHLSIQCLFPQIYCCANSISKQEWIQGCYLFRGLFLLYSTSFFILIKRIPWTGSENKAKRCVLLFGHVKMNYHCYRRKNKDSK